MSSEVRLSTLADYAQAHRISAVCMDCDRQEELPLPRLMEQLGRDAKLADLRGRVRCRSCGKRTGELVVSPAGVSGPR